MPGSPKPRKSRDDVYGVRSRQPEPPLQKKTVHGFRRLQMFSQVTLDQSPSVLQSSTPWSRMARLSKSSSARVQVTPSPPSPPLILIKDWRPCSYTREERGGAQTRTGGGSSKWRYTCSPNSYWHAARSA